MYAPVMQQSCRRAIRRTFRAKELLAELSERQRACSIPATYIYF